MGGRRVIVFFGAQWDSGIFDGAKLKQIATPVGQPCTECAKPFEPGDRGRVRFGGGLVHAECELRQVMGSVAHLTGRCRCRGFDEADFPGSPYEEAQEVLRIINKKRAACGLDPM